MIAVNYGTNRNAHAQDKHSRSTGTMLLKALIVACN
jgi:hypothetical protein